MPAALLPAAPSPSRTEIVADLRRRLARLEGVTDHGDGCLPFGLPRASAAKDSSHQRG